MPSPLGDTQQGAFRAQRKTDTQQLATIVPTILEPTNTITNNVFDLETTLPTVRDRHRRPRVCPPVVTAVTSDGVTLLVLTTALSWVRPDPQEMTSGTDTSRIIAACVECGAVYAALRLSEGKIQPIGSRNGCGSCGGTEFIPVPEFSDDSGSLEAND